MMLSLSFPAARTPEHNAVVFRLAAEIGHEGRLSMVFAGLKADFREENLRRSLVDDKIPFQTKING